MKKSKIVATIIWAIIVVVGVFSVVYNFVIVYNSDLKFLTYKTIKASISTVQTSYVDGETFYSATYSFTVDNMGYGCSAGYTSDPDKYVVGDVANVRYNPANPNNCYLMNDTGYWNYLYLGISCIILIIGIKFFDKNLRLE